MRALAHDHHDYGFVIFPINGGLFYPDAKFAVVEMDSDEDGFFLECQTKEEAEEELQKIVEFVVDDGL